MSRGTLLNQIDRESQPMMLKQTAFGAITGALLLIAFIFYVVAQADPSYGVAKVGSITVGATGLWSDNLVENCNGDTACNKIKAARAFFVMATIVAFIAGVLLLYITFKATYPKVLYLASVALALAAFLFGLIGWAIGMSQFVRSPWTMGAASALGLIGWIFCLIALVLAVLMREHTLI
ncbi:unnamed protein product [Didymodactylos carnosus]|uniref:Uncharacterized protein n=1 Tax=Didymodactylos carnosus TaxID=1234261 RepID=A0A815IJL2_9BILA|nr:unnamed protein product [Didymodactylos carnosus]CAF1366824.1 unnamed protein product [Didymodactylos carnosus]CAF3924628.1 unnamed protein product [Didymodactylos carnosus]CAF4249612.1 unnamed protein product [Didymodactylos carnosus]